MQIAVYCAIDQNPKRGNSTRIKNIAFKKIILPKVRSRCASLTRRQTVALHALPRFPEIIFLEFHRFNTGGG